MNSSFWLILQTSHKKFVCLNLLLQKAAPLGNIITAAFICFYRGKKKKTKKRHESDSSESSESSDSSESSSDYSSSEDSDSDDDKHRRRKKSKKSKVRENPVKTRCRVPFRNSFSIS